MTGSRTNGPFHLDVPSGLTPEQQQEWKSNYKRVDLIACSPHDWCDVLVLAAKIGVTDAMVGNKPRSRKELVAMLATQYRNGHATALKHAYSAGRFHVDVMGKD